MATKNRKKGANHKKTQLLAPKSLQQIIKNRTHNPEVSKKENVLKQNAFDEKTWECCYPSDGVDCNSSQYSAALLV